jgi:hypothetical protein
MKLNNPDVQIEITNATRLCMAGHEPVELAVGDVLTIPASDALDLVGSGKAVKAKKGARDGPHGREAAEAREKAAQEAAKSKADPK